VSVLNPGPSDAAAIVVQTIYNTNLTDIYDLDPQNDLKVYYEEPGEETNAAFLSFADLKHPTVVLGHSSYITIMKERSWCISPLAVWLRTHRVSGLRPYRLK
jgi:hypothetical protein